MLKKESKYTRKNTPAIRDAVLQRTALGESLLSISQRDGMPARDSVRDWRLADPEFDAQFLRAKALGLDKMADDILEIVDDLNDEAASRRVRADARFRILAARDSKVWGTNRTAIVGGEPDDRAVQIDVSGLSDATLRELAKVTLSKA